MTLWVGNLLTDIWSEQTIRTTRAESEQTKDRHTMDYAKWPGSIDDDGKPELSQKEETSDDCTSCRFVKYSKHTLGLSDFSWHRKRQQKQHQRYSARSALCWE